MNRTLSLRLAVAPLTLAQVAVTPHLPIQTLSLPWDAGTIGEALFQASSGTTIPMFSYSFHSTKDGSTRTGAMVGTSPFVTPTGVSIPVVVVPIKMVIGTHTFDPGAGDSCDGGVSTVSRFNSSPLVSSVTNLTMNGVNVGMTQYIGFNNGFRRAEFWSSIGGSSSYQNGLSFTTAAEVSVSTGSAGITYASGCNLLGIVSNSSLDSFLRTTLIPSLTSSGVISPTKFALFLLRNVVQSTSYPPSVSHCCVLGYHSAAGNPVQTYSVMEWDTTGDFGAGVADGAVASHEIAEWMDDPLGNNLTPAWGNVGQVSGCQGNLEVGDPLSGTLVAFTMNGKTYHMQELGFFSWYFNSQGTASLGAGGKFSSNGKFSGPSKACPPGGTY